ncbi:MAG: hypothetical protein R2845_04010 [Thermomicrobiales bacterium]
MKQYSRRSALRMISAPVGALALASVLPTKMLAQDSPTPTPAISSVQRRRYALVGRSTSGTPSTPLTEPAAPVREGDDAGFDPDRKG